MYSPDGMFEWNGAAWIPRAAPPPPPPAYAPPPPAAAYAPPPGYPAQPPGAVAPPPYAPPAPPAYAPPAAAQPPFAQTPYVQPGPGGTVAFGEVAWSSGIPIGKGYVIRIEDIEAGKSQQQNDKLMFTGTTLQPNGMIAAGYKAVWSYTLTEKAVGKLGRDMVAVGLGAKHYPRDVNALAQALLADMRGMIVVVDSDESKSSELPNVSITGRYEGGGPQPVAQSPFPPAAPAPAAAPPAYAPPPAPPAPPYAAAPPPPVSFPTAPPPPPGAPPAPPYQQV